jgi:uncharacterized membrane protein YkoI|tara:strand:- start:345 stop:689 length:345 start_codon:yes stop_codon:yes gene_type:complete
MKLLSNLRLALILFSASITESQSLQSPSVQISLAGQFEHVAEQETSGRTQKFVVTSRQDAIRKAKGRYQGKVLKAQFVRIKGNSGYKIKMLSAKGVVFYVYVDARTGEVIKRSR